MQRYQPCLHITCQRDGVTQSYTFKETKFIAVTAYQNNRVTINNFYVTYTLLIYTVVPFSYR